MKKYTAWILGLAMGVFVLGTTTSCVDKIAFGNSFLEKASGSTVTSDTVFGSAEYTEQFLTFCYSLQYYGMPYRNTTSETFPMESSNIYVGKPSALTDLYVFTYTSCGITGPYYSGTHSANYGQRSDKFDYTRNSVWELIRACWLLIENVDDVPDMDDDRKEEMKAEAKCIMVSRYFDIWRHYGGVPLIYGSFSGTESSYDYPRGSIEECVDFMVGLLDEAIDVLDWNVETPATDAGHWGRAAAMAYKCRILQFAASPIFNDTEPYYSGITSSDDVADAIWYGNYSSSRWTDLLTACEEFFTQLTLYGEFELVQASGTRPEDYRAAYRSAYWLLDSPEVLMSTRVTTTDSAKSSTYTWHSWGSPTGSIHRGYSPTQEYMVMFPWADGTPFDWDDLNWTTDSNGYQVKGSDESKTDPNLMFFYGNIDSDDGVTLTRDPRMYEEILVNGCPISLDETTGNMSGLQVEAWVSGYHAGTNANTQTGSYATGYAPQKFIQADDAVGDYVAWPSIRLAEMYLIYAEALLQTGSLSKAVEQIDIVRARVGLGGLADCNPSLNLTSNADNLLEELLRERACELGMEDARFFDLVRYKRADIFATQCHGLRLHRMKDGELYENKWYGNDNSSVDFPEEYAYEVFELTNPRRYWWTSGFADKWYLSPFPATEVNLDYGLIQNPGW